MISSNIERDPVIYLDTNVLHYMVHYLSLAKGQGWSPYSGEYDDASLHSRLTTPPPLGMGFPRTTVKYLQGGWRTLRYLQSRVASRCRLMASLASWAELKHGAQENCAQRQLQEGGMTYRMRIRLSVKQESVHDLLMLDGYRSANRRLSEARSVVEPVIGQPLSYARPDDITSILAVANLLQGRVYLDLIDCVVLADAMYQEASELITSDEWLRTVTNLIHNPGGAKEPEAQRYWSQVQGTIKRLIASDRNIKPGELQLPEGKRPLDLSQDVPVQVS